MAGEAEATRWRMKAIEALAIADEMTNPDTKAIMLTIAAGYDRLAEQAETYVRAVRDTAELPPQKT